jgi:hypothetical protein
MVEFPPILLRRIQSDLDLFDHGALPDDVVDAGRFDVVDVVHGDFVLTFLQKAVVSSESKPATIFPLVD